MALTRSERRRLRHTKDEKFLKIFRFFYKSYYYNIVDFTGSKCIKTILDLNAPDAKVCFIIFNNGEYSHKEMYETGIPTKQPLLLKTSIMGKKGWGLWMQEWSKGIAEWNFTEEEILLDFKLAFIEIPESLLLDFRNTWRSKRNIIMGL